MKRQLFVALIAFTSTLLIHSQTSKTPSTPQANVEREVREVIRQRIEALRRGDVRTYASFFASDCVITSDTGALLTPKEIAREFASALHSGITYKGSEPMDVKFYAYGDMAVANFRLELDEDWGGQKLLGSSRFTDVFARRGERWQLVAHQETPIPNTRRLAVKVDPSVFDAYAGEYQLTPNYIVKVKREGDKLMDQWPEDTEYVEGVPLSETTFVARGQAGEMIYVRDETGKVSHFILRTVSGDLIAKKIK